jgi:DNA-binding transcriptional LysR family regulator
MDTDRLRYFCTIAQSGSMRRASELLRVSPPALSKATRLLEEELGFKLFNRAGRNIVLTDEGRRLARRGAEVLKDLEQLVVELESSRACRREMKIATFEVFSTYFLAFLEHMDWEDTPIAIHDVLPGELERALADRQADLGITYMPVPTPEIEYLKICSIEMGVFTRQGTFPGVAQKDLPFVVPVLPITGTPTRVRGLDGWPEDAYARQVRYQVTLMESALELCRQGRAAGYFPLFVVERHNAQVRDPLRLVRRLSPYPGRVCTTDVYIVKRRGDLESKLIKRLARAIRMVARPK